MALCLMEVPRLRYLELIKYTLSSNTNIHVISPNGGQWWDSEDPPETPELANPLDYIVEDLLYNSIKSCKDCIIPWRTGCSLRYITVSGLGVKKHSVYLYVTPAYELREDSFEMEPSEIHLDSELAPRGTEYTFENSGVRVTIRAIEPSSRYVRNMGLVDSALSPPCTLERAFKNTFRKYPLEKPDFD